MAWRETCATGRAKGSRTPTETKQSKYQCETAPCMALRHCIKAWQAAFQLDVGTPRRPGKSHGFLSIPREWH